MMQHLLVKVCREWSFIRPHVWKQAYNFLGQNYPAEACSYMNYGYATSSGGVDIASHQEIPEQYCLQLYNYVVNPVSLRHRDVLEVGCGRGGGAQYLKTRFEPSRLLGVDFSFAAVRLCSKYRQEGLYFLPGNAESLPIGEQRFDIAINIESSHCYRSIERFLREVKRVLRPEGYFLYADFCQTDQLDDRRQLLCRSGMSILREDNITANVLAALELDSERRSALIQRYVRASLAKSFREFVGCRGSRVFNDFNERRKVYFRFILVKR